MAACRSQQGSKAALVAFREKTPDLHKEIRERGTLRGNHRLPRMFMVGKRLSLRMVWGIIVAEDHIAGCGLPVVSIAEPCQSVVHDRKRFADNEAGVIRQMESDTKVRPGGRKELFPILLNVALRKGTDRPLNLGKIIMEGAHATVFSRLFSSWRRPRYCW